MQFLLTSNTMSSFWVSCYLCSFNYFIWYILSYIFILNVRLDYSITNFSSVLQTYDVCFYARCTLGHMVSGCTSLLFKSQAPEKKLTKLKVNIPLFQTHPQIETLFETQIETSLISERQDTSAKPHFRPDLVRLLLKICMEVPTELIIQWLSIRVGLSSSAILFMYRLYIFSLQRFP